MKLTKTKIKKAVAKPKWQSFRVSLKGKPTQTKIKRLKAYAATSKNPEQAQIQVQNYINALKRGGQLK